MVQFTGGQPSREQLEEWANAAAKRVQQVVPEGVGFVVFTFHLGRGGFMAYASNAERPSTIEALLEWIDRSKPGLDRRAQVEALTSRLLSLLEDLRMEEPGWLALEELLAAKSVVARLYALSQPGRPE